MKKSDADLAKQLAAIRQSRSRKNKNNPSSSSAAGKQMTLDGQVVDEAGGIVHEPPPKRQRKPKAKPVADDAAQQEETTQKEVAGDAEQTIGDQSNKETEIPASAAQNAPENTGSILADPLANGFDARQFTEATLDVKGSGAEFVASHGIEETLFQLMRHEVLGACLVGSVMDALQVEKDRFKRLELDYKIAKTSIMDLTRQDRKSTRLNSSH